MPKRRKTRIYWRERGGERRAYGDFRDLGGGREALIPRGEVAATTDPDVAAELVSQRVKELEARRRGRAITGVEREAGLEAFAADHLRKKAKAGKTSTTWLEQSERALTVAVAFFGADRDLASVGVQDVQAYLDHLRTLPNGRRRPDGTEETLAPSSQRHYLNILSNLYRRAISEGYVPPGFNPVAGLMEKPSNKPEREARWLDVAEGAILLEAARRYAPAADAKAGPIHELLATYLLTGGRTSEVLGLEVDDVSFRRRTITFRENRWRGLKTKTSRRVVPLWPQLEEVLRPYMLRREREGGIGRLLFPSPQAEEEAMISDFRKVLDAVAALAGWEAGAIRSKMFRHTYCAARLQTLDRGEPVSPFTVARELGHASTAMVERVYSHLGEVRHRSEVVEYRVQHHAATLGRRLEALPAG